MKKLVMILIVLGMLMALPATAGAKKPPPGQEPFPGLTCQAWFKSHDDSLFQVGVENNDFSLTLDSDTPAACFDVDSQAGDWEISLETIKVASLQMQIKDSVPGDFCFREGWGKKKNPIPDSPWSINVRIPEATIDACTPGEVGLAADQDPKLVFMVSYTPERKTTDSEVTIHVDLP